MVADSPGPAEQLPIEAVRSRYYIRALIEDRPGVLATLADVLGQRDISIRSVLQHELPAGSDPANGVPLVITTHHALEGDIRAALAAAEATDVIKAKITCIGIVDEHPEQL